MPCVHPVIRRSRATKETQRNELIPPGKKKTSSNKVLINNTNGDIVCTSCVDHAVASFV